MFDAQPSTRFGLYDLNVWAQPSSWDPEKGEKPTVQFDISAVNYIGSEPIISYFVADHLGHKPCEFTIVLISIVLHLSSVQLIRFRSASFQGRSLEDPDFE